MATTYYPDLQKLYVAYFNRPADATGLAYYEGVMEAAKDKAAALAQISADFAKSSEYTAAFDGKTSAQIVDIIYTNIFGHAADDTGRKFYADNLDAKKVTLANVVTEVAKGAQGTDLTAYNAKLSAAAAFSAAVDTDAEKAGYSGDAANKIAKTFLAGVTDAVSLAAATAPANLNATVASAVAAGTPFTVAGSLAQIAAAQKAVDDFVTATVTKDADSNGTKDSADITYTQTKAKAAVVADLTDASAKTLFNTTSSADVRNALIADQQTANAKSLAAAQKLLADDNTAIAKVPGLSDAIAAVASAKNSLKVAQTAEVATNADYSAKNAAFGVNNGGTTGLTLSGGTNLQFTKTGGTATTVATIDATGKATLATGIDATKYVGLTELIAAYNVEATAAANIVKAQTNLDASLLVVNLLDLGPDSAAVGTYANEKTLLAAVAAKVNAVTPDSVADGTVPTAGQIQTTLAVLKAKADQTEYTAFKNMIAADVTDLAKLTVDLNTAVAANTAAQATALAKHTAAVTAENSFAGGQVVVGAADLKVGSTVLANLDATTKIATVASGITETNNPGVTDLIKAYNADVTAAAAAAAALSAKNTAQTAYDASAPLNPLVKVQAIDAASVDAIATAISTLSKDVAALQTANTNADALTGLQSAVQGYTDALKDKGYNPVTLDAAHAISFATAKSDVYLVGKTDASISAFGIQGTDSVFVGKGYTLVQGSLTGADAVKGSDAALEVFVSKSGADTILKVETHAYSSSVVGGVGEVVTITLTGVDASTIKLDSTGIITGTAA